MQYIDPLSGMIKDYSVDTTEEMCFTLSTGEKIAEVLITKDESKNTLEFKNHYVINSEIFGNHNKKKYKLKDFEYNSSKNSHFLNEKQIRLICKNLKLI